MAKIQSEYKKGIALMSTNKDVGINYNEIWSVMTQVFYSTLLMMVFIGLAYVSAVGDRSGVVTEEELTNWANFKQEKPKEGTRVIGDHPLEKERLADQIGYHPNCYQDHNTPTSGSDID